MYLTETNSLKAKNFKKNQRYLCSTKALRKFHFYLNLVLTKNKERLWMRQEVRSSSAKELRQVVRLATVPDAIAKTS